MVVVIMRQNHQIGRIELLHLGHEGLAANNRTAVHHNHAVVSPTVALHDKRIPMLDL